MPAAESSVNGRVVVSPSGSTEPDVELQRGPADAAEFQQVVHDLKNWLCGIGMLANAALVDLEDKSATRDTLEQIQNAANDATGICRTLLAEPTEPVPPAVREPLQIADVLRHMRPLLEANLPVHATLVWELRPHLLEIIGDRRQLERLVLNLLHNAADALQGQPGDVTIRSDLAEIGHALTGASRPKRNPTPGHYVCLEIADSGCGMDEATLARIFDPSFTTKACGHGFGLKSVQAIVGFHRGLIDVQSVPGEGTSVRVLFPCAH